MRSQSDNDLHITSELAKNLKLKKKNISEFKRSLKKNNYIACKDRKEMTIYFDSI